MELTPDNCLGKRFKIKPFYGDKLFYLWHRTYLFESWTFYDVRTGLPAEYLKLDMTREEIDNFLKSKNITIDVIDGFFA